MKRQYDFSKARRGPVVPLTPGKTRITIRLDNDVIEHFQATVNRAGGGNYQTLINNALREYMRGTRLETVVRKAVREEVKAVREALKQNRLDGPGGVGRAIDYNQERTIKNGRHP